MTETRGSLRGWCEKRTSVNLPAGVWVAFAIALTLAVMLPVTHDYVAYLRHWQHVLQGGDPWLNAQGWFNNNSYGPVYVALAYPAGLYSKLPRILGVAVWFAAVGVIWQVCSSRVAASGSALRQGALWSLVASPFVICVGVVWANNDVIAGGLVILAIAARSRKKTVLLALCLAMSAALKYYTFFLIPYFVFDRTPGVIRRAALLALFTGAAFLLAYLVWGTSVFVPIGMGAIRPATWFSIFRFLDGSLTPLEGTGVYGPNLVIATQLVFLVFYLFRIRDYLYGVVVSSLLLLFFYQVGHHQFHLLPFFLLMSYVALRGVGGWKRATFYLLYLVPLNLTVLFYDDAYGFRKGLSFVQDAVGLPVSIGMAGIIMGLLREAAAGNRFWPSTEPHAAEVEGLPAAGSSDG